VWRVTLKELLAHRFRLALTALAIMLGVGFVAGTFMFTDTIDLSFDELFAEATSDIDVVVRADTAFIASGPGTTGETQRIPESLLPKVRGVEGVADAQGFVQGYAQLVDEHGEAVAPQGPPTLGVSWIPGELSALSLREGRRPEHDGEVAIDARTAKEHGFEVGERATVLSLGPPEEFEVVGIAGFGSADNLGGSTLAIFETETAQRVLDAEGEFDSITVGAVEGVAPPKLRERIAAIVPKDVEVATATRVAQEQAGAVKEALGFLNTALLVFAGVALFVGAFIIYNTFNILVTQRSRELALLRTLGASARQVTAVVVGEALLVGVLASGIGIGAGALMSYGLRALLDAFGVSLVTSGLQLLPRTVVVSLVVGTVVTLVSSILPARRAARVPPIAALRDVEPVRPLSLRRRALGGAAVTGAGAVSLAAGLTGAGGGLALVGSGVAITFVGVTILSPLVSRRLARWIGAPLPGLAGVPGKLGRENAMRNPRRTAATSAALMIGMALVATFAIFGESVKASAGAVISDAYRADLALSANNGISPISPEVAVELRRLDEVSVVSEFRGGVFRLPGQRETKFLTAIDPETVEEVLDLDVVEGRFEDLDRDGVFVHEEIATERGLSVGDPFRMEFPETGERKMEIAGIFEESRIVGSYAVGLDAQQVAYASDLDQFLMLNAAPNVPLAGARRAVDEVVEGFPNVKVRDQAELQEEQERQVDQLLGLVTALLALAILIALLGIVNTLALSVIERTRELGLLRAVGLSRRQTRAMVRWESVIIALFGGILGLGVGALFGWALVTAIADEGFSELAFPIGRLVVFLVLAGIAGVLAAVGPARRAAKLNVLEAIATE